MEAYMHEVMTRFPNHTALIEAAPADLAIAVLRGIVGLIGPRATWPPNGPRFVPLTNLVSDVVNGVTEGPQARAAAGDAIAWLSSHDLIAELYLRGSSSGPTIVPTALGYQVAAASDGVGGAAHAIRALDLVPPALRVRVAPALVAGTYEDAITTAFRAVEVRMRERAGLSTNDFGSRLSRKFFQKVEATRLQRADRRGDLSDEERLFEGLLGLYRDRAVHEAPHVDSIEYALEVVIAAGHLLRIVEAAELDA
jgi:hypothetical protein